ncbi:MAG: serine/threonine protein kinase [Planctomycetes bacterium]|nr:serine/threonine protein kinase [Planctomycetota bacterium]
MTPELTHEQRRRIEELFHQAVALAGEQRAALLDRACTDDPVVRHEVEQLLHHHDTRTNTAPPGDVTPTTGGALRDAVAVLDDMSGEHVGPYKLLQRIGTGGFGDVYMADQEEPIRRRVALKIIKLGMDTGQVIARFEAERQALTMMDHPNIAKVLDAGATDAGRPYFVMELVKGEPITAYCDREKLSIADRLELFTQLCHAVQHAHSKGVIHRDIKPSNVLVSMVDGRHLAKVIDFGIAKATNHRLTEKTLFTEFNQMIGTPEYMSPEQAGGSPDIDTRTDIYSLGVLLYELLAGAPPFDPEQFRSAAYAEVQRIIREVEPPKPSTRLSRSTDTLPSIAATRSTEPKKLGLLLRGELDWIVMKCLEKDRGRRYETANGLAEDIQRHLAGESVIAAPPSAGYRIRKFIRHHRVGVTAATIVIVVLLLGSASTSWGIVWALAERDKTRIAETRAQALADQLQVLFATLEPPRTGDFEPPTDIPARVQETEAALKVRFANQPDNEAIIRSSLAVVYARQGLPKEAASQAFAAYELRRHMLGAEHAETRRAQRLAAKLLNNLSVRQRETGDYEEAERTIRKVIVLDEQVYGPRGPRTQVSRANLAAALVKLKRFKEAESIALAIHEEGWTGHPEFLRYWMIELYDGWGKPKKVAEWRKRAAENAKWIAAYDAAHQRDRAGDAVGAEDHWREAIASMRKTQDKETNHLGNALNGLAIALRDQGKFEEAAEAFDECLEVRQRELPPGHWHIGYTRSQLGELLGQMKRFAEAEPLVIAGYESMASDPNNEFPFRTGEALLRIIALYAEWHAAEPDAGYDAKAAEWRAKLPAP